MSHAEFLWWMARGTIKPLDRDLIYHNRLMQVQSISHFSGQAMFKDTSLDWYAKTQEDIDKDLMNNVRKRQQELNEKKEKENG